MRQICLLMAMLMMCSVSGRGRDNLREAAETEPNMDDSTINVRRKETTVCGRRQILTSKRDEGKGGSNDDDQSDHLDKILGVSDVTSSQFPWVVHLYYFERVCSGAIINEFWILTTARCLYYFRKTYLRVLAVNHRLSIHDGTQQKFSVQRKVIHRLYKSNSNDYDIALIKVKPKNGRGIRFNNYVQPICLPAAGERPADNDNLTMLGLGNYLTDSNTWFGHSIPTHVLPVVNNTECRDYISSGVVTDRILCVGRVYEDFDMCKLDYGGPATFQSGDTHILAGIIINDHDCWPPSIPSLLTNVLVLRDWIYDRINEFSNARQRVIPPRAD